MPGDGQFVQSLLLRDALLPIPFLKISPFQFFHDLMLFAFCQKLFQSLADDLLPPRHLQFQHTSSAFKAIDILHVVPKLMGWHFGCQISVQRFVGPAQALLRVYKRFLGQFELPIRLRELNLSLVFEVAPVGQECFKPESKRHFTFRGRILSVPRLEQGSD